MKYVVEVDGDVVDEATYSIQRGGAIAFRDAVDDGRNIAVYQLEDDGTLYRFDTYTSKPTAAGNTLLFSDTDGREFTKGEKQSLRGNLPGS